MQLTGCGHGSCMTLETIVPMAISEQNYTGACGGGGRKHEKVARKESPTFAHDCGFSAAYRSVLFGLGVHDSTVQWLSKLMSSSWKVFQSPFKWQILEP